MFSNKWTKWSLKTTVRLLGSVEQVCNVDRRTGSFLHLAYLYSPLVSKQLNEWVICFSTGTDLLLIFLHSAVYRSCGLLLPSSLGACLLMSTSQLNKVHFHVPQPSWKLKWLDIPPVRVSVPSLGLGTTAHSGSPTLSSSWLIRCLDEWGDGSTTSGTSQGC